MCCSWLPSLRGCESCGRPMLAHRKRRKSAHCSDALGTLARTACAHRLEVAGLPQGISIGCPGPLSCRWHWLSPTYMSGPHALAALSPLALAKLLCCMQTCLWRCSLPAATRLGEAASVHRTVQKPPSRTVGASLDAAIKVSAQVADCIATAVPTLAGL